MTDLHTPEPLTLYRSTKLQEYTSLGELMIDMGLVQYLDTVIENLNPGVFDYDETDWLYVLSRKIGRYGFKFFKNRTPIVKVYESESESESKIKIRVYISFDTDYYENNESRYLYHEVEMMKLLIKYCYQEKYWDKLEISGIGTYTDGFQWGPY